MSIKAKMMSLRDQIIISVFIIAYWFVILVCVSADCPAKQFFHKYTRNVELLFAISQSWRMFCPNPRSYSLHCYAIITFKDGSTAYYEFPRLEKMNQLLATLRERLRKHYYDIMPWFEFRMFRPYIASYIAQGFSDPSNPPIQVSLCYNRGNIPPMPHFRPRTPLPVESGRENFYVYQVRPEDLH